MTEPTTYGRYTVERELGRGSMGVVYLATDPVIKRKVAIKVLWSNPALDEKSREDLQARFEQEFQTMGTLPHPNIVTIYDVARQDDTSFIAMEYVEGDSLQDRVEADWTPGPQEAANLAVEIAGALDAAHERGIIHRDVKPANILLTPDGTPKITDFGVAKLGDQQLTQTGALIGTPAYMSPEQAAGKGVTKASDQFSLAVIFYELLTGDRPFKGESATGILYKIVHEDPPNPRELNPDLPETVERVLLMALSKDPGDRYPSCRAFAEALGDALTAARSESTAASATIVRTVTDAVGGDTLGDRSGPRGERSGDRLRRWGAIAGAVIAAILGIWFVASSIQGGSADPAADDTGTVAGDTGSTVADATGGAPADIDAPSVPDPADSGERGGEDGPTAESSGAKGEGEPGASGTDEGGEAERSGPDEGAETGSSERGPDPEAAAATAEGDGEPATPEPVTYRVVTDPAGASVQLDGESVDGTTPMEVDLTPGERHRLQVSLEDHRSQGLTFTLDDLTRDQRSSRTLRFPMQPTRPPGTIAFEAQYPLSVTVDGRTYEQVEQREIEVPEGTYELELSAPSVHFRATKRVEVTGNETTNVSVPRAVRIDVIANPSNCIVYIDGERVDFAPINDLLIVAGEHEFAFEWPGRVSARVTQRTSIYEDGQRIFATPDQR